MKICFDFICDEALVFSYVASKYKEKGVDVVGITLGNRWSQGWLNLYSTMPLDVDSVLKIDEAEEASRIAKEYAGYGVSSFPQADRFISDLERSEQRKILVHTFLKIEELVDSGVDVFVTTGVAYLYNLVILAVAEKRGVVAVSLYGTRQADSRFTVSLSRGGVWDLVSDEYNKLKEAQADHLNLDKYHGEIDAFKMKASSPGYMKSARQEGGLKKIFFKEFFLRLKAWYVDGWKQPSDYITQHPLWYAYRDVKRIANKFFLRSAFSFDDADLKNSFYIYPIHLQPEASTLILGEDYVDQENTIKLIARSIPADSLLYVKEHPAAYGRNSLAFYKELKKIHNVRVLSPSVDVRKLILKSKGVVVVSGTMGWEALLLGKPVVVLGEVFYDRFDGAYKISSSKELRSVFSDRLRSPNQNLIALALKAIIDGSFEGYFDVHKLDTYSKVMNKENLSLIHQGLTSAIDKASCRNVFF